MNLRSLALMAILLGSAFSPAWAQFPRYVPPAGRTLPNELDYFRRDVGVLDPYNTFVDPRRQVERQFQQMARQQELDYQANRRAISQIRQSQASPTGSGSVFMSYGQRYGNLSHYYGARSYGPAIAPRRAR